MYPSEEAAFWIYCAQNDTLQCHNMYIHETFCKRIEGRSSPLKLLFLAFFSGMNASTVNMSFRKMLIFGYTGSIKTPRPIISKTESGMCKLCKEFFR